MSNNLATFVCRLSGNSGSLNLLEHLGTVQAYIRFALLYLYIILISIYLCVSTERNYEESAKESWRVASLNSTEIPVNEFQKFSVLLAKFVALKKNTLTPQVNMLFVGYVSTHFRL